MSQERLRELAVAAATGDPDALLELLRTFARDEGSGIGAPAPRPPPTAVVRPPRQTQPGFILEDAPICDRVALPAGVTEARIPVFVRPVGSTCSFLGRKKLPSDTNLWTCGRLAEPESEDVWGVSFIADSWTRRDAFHEVLCRSTFEFWARGTSHRVGDWPCALLGIYPWRDWTIYPPDPVFEFEGSILLGINESFRGDWVVNLERPFDEPVSGMWVLHGRRYFVDVIDNTTGIRRSLRRSGPW